MVLEPANIATITVAVVGLLSMWISQRISAKASMQNQRSLAEVEAYARAVKMDRETIARQKEEILELVQDKKSLKMENSQLKIDGAKKDVTNRALVKQVLELQEKLREKSHG